MPFARTHWCRCFRRNIIREPTFDVFTESELGKTDLMTSPREDDLRIRTRAISHVTSFRLLIRALCDTLTDKTLFRSANAVQVNILNLIISISLSLHIVAASYLLVRWVICQRGATFHSSDLAHSQLLDRRRLAKRAFPNTLKH